MDDSFDPLFTSESPEIIGGEYTANEPIRVLKGLEAVRERPGMYLGDVGERGLHQLFKDVVDTSINEVLNGYCTKIHVAYGADGSLSVDDNGRSIPVEVNAETGKTVLEMVLTEIGVERTLDSRGSESKQTFAVWHNSSGAVCANALSEWLECEVKRDGEIHRMRFERGVPNGPLMVVGECGQEEHGTKITWLADTSVFVQAQDEGGSLNYSPDRMRDRLRELAFLNGEVAISFTDARNGKATETFYFPRGVADFVAHLNEGKTSIHDAIFSVSAREGDQTQIEAALQFHDGNEETIVAYANNIALTDDSTPFTGFKTALTRTVNRYARKHDFLQTDDSNFKGASVRPGLTAVISIRLTDPHFWNAVKTRLYNTEIEGKVNRVVAKALAYFFDENPDAARAIVGKISAATKAR